MYGLTDLSILTVNLSDNRTISSLSSQGRQETSFLLGQTANDQFLFASSRQSSSTLHNFFPLSDDFVSLQPGCQASEMWRDILIQVFCFQHWQGRIMPAAIQL